jgi:NADPH-dependent 2,4-dienoyl-CoA reductase/sulfur reductase-like enzyme
VTHLRHVAVVGAGLAGLRAAEAVLSCDQQARVSLLGEEAVAPYTRPPLSKAVLAGSTDVGGLALRQRPQRQGRLTLRPSSPVVASDLEGRQVTLADGAVVAWDGLVVATGLRPRRLDVPGPKAGRYALRSAADALALRSALGSAVYTRQCRFNSIRKHFKCYNQYFGLSYCGRTLMASSKG